MKLMEKKVLLIIAYENLVEQIRTTDPDKEIRKAFMVGNVVSIIKNNKIIYTKAGKI